MIEDEEAMSVQVESRLLAPTQRTMRVAYSMGKTW